MSPTAPADAVVTESHIKTSDGQTSNMANLEFMEEAEAHEETYNNDDNEDPATQAASENLKHASISEKELPEDRETSEMREEDSPPEQLEKEHDRPLTPKQGEPSDAQDEEMKERVSSPKKKRGRELDDESRDLETVDTVEDGASSPNGNAINGGRTTRLAPEKKRHRDASVDRIIATESAADTKEPFAPEAVVLANPATSTSLSSEKSPETLPNSEFGSGTKLKDQTSASAFASSGFGSVAASSTSGFAALAASKANAFGSGTLPQLSGFGSLTGSNAAIPDTSNVRVGLGGTIMEPLSGTLGGGFGNVGTAGFGTLGSAFGGGFTGFTGGSGPKLSSFAVSGIPDIAGAEKPVKAFGAPESDEEDGSEEDDESRGVTASDEEGSISVDDKRKLRVSRVPVHDGEEGEATMVQVRAKLFAHIKEIGWKERGAGNLKINVPRICVDYDENGNPIPGTFDPSARDDSDEEGRGTVPASARLIMRQDHTHRVILNSVILKGLKFEEKPATTGSVQIIFTALEEKNPVNMILRMTEANAKLFASEIRSIQQEL